MRYRLGPVLGQGGMAEVFDAELVGADGFRRRVALKRIRQDFATEERFKTMFVDEARIASQLHHASIVGVVDYGLLDGLPFQVLELVEGEDLHRIAKLARRRARAIPIEVGVHVCREVAYALGYAHHATGDDGRSLGIVHRDVSPSNILCSWGGDVKLTDFGIALAHERQSEQTEIGVTKGKRSYMSPETLLGEQVDGRADLFALGCVLHWFCTGRSPLSDPSAVAELIRRGKLELDSRIPEAVRTIIDRATRAERSERYPDGEAMGDALAEAFQQLSERGGRACLRELLDELRPEGSEVPPTYDREIAPDVSASGPDAERTLLTRETVGAKPSRLATPDEPAASGGARHRLLVGAALAIVAAAGGAWVAVEAMTSESPSAAHVDVPVAPETTPTPPSPVEPEPEETVAAAETAPATEEAPETVPAREADVTPHRRTSAPPAHRPAPRPEATETGYLFVGGAGSLNHSILVDGVNRGRAPRRIELPLGSHRVELHDPSGETVDRRDVDVTAANTSRRPLRWLR